MTASKSLNIDQVWSQFIQTREDNVRHNLITNYMWLVRYVIQNMNLPNNSILGDNDFLNIGILGLNESIQRFDPERGVKFESYAIPRIKGIIQDELRKLDWLSRTARKKAHDLMQAGDELRSKMGREVSPNEIMKQLNISADEYNSYLKAAAAAKASLSLSETSQALMDTDERNFLDEIPDTEQDSIITQIESEERIDFLSNYLKHLNERKRLVMTLYYYEDLTFKEIGTVLNVSESRICQIHGQVINDLKKKLKEFDNA